MESGFSVLRDLPYLEPERAEKLDLYVPDRADSARRLPAVVVIHGGGWFSQRKDLPREQNVCSCLAANGYACASIDYRLVDLDRRDPAAQAAWPRNVQDCKSAVWFLRENAERFGIDPDFIAALGGSAGGHLAAMLGCTGPAHGFDPPEAPPPRPGLPSPFGVQAVVFMYGIGDLLHWARNAPVKRKGLEALALMMGGTPAEVPERYRAASPLTYAGPSSAPMLILHGTADEVVSFRESVILAEELRRRSVQVELELVEGAVHSFDLEPPQRDLRPVVLDFLQRARSATRSRRAPGCGARCATPRGRAPR